MIVQNSAKKSCTYHSSLKKNNYYLSLTNHGFITGSYYVFHIPCLSYATPLLLLFYTIMRIT